MGLLQKLIKTYDVMADKYAGVYIDGMREPLAPVSHALQNAQIEITIDSNGCFIFIGREDPVVAMLRLG